MRNIKLHHGRIINQNNGPCCIVMVWFWLIRVFSFSQITRRDTEILTRRSFRGYTPRASNTQEESFGGSVEWGLCHAHYVAKSMHDLLRERERIRCQASSAASGRYRGRRTYMDWLVVASARRCWFQLLICLSSMVSPHLISGQPWEIWARQEPGLRDTTAFRTQRCRYRF